jgi:hypothetical protein
MKKPSISNFNTQQFLFLFERTFANEFIGSTYSIMSFFANKASKAILKNSFRKADLVF